MKLDNFGRVRISEQELFDAIYNGKISNLENVLLDGDTGQYNRARQQNADAIVELKSLPDNEFDNIEDFDRYNRDNWFMPEEYRNMDIEGFLVHICPKENYQRLIDELKEFRARDMIMLLRWLKYFVDTAKKHNIVWGVGRGSSVSSYVLYLLGVHRIDSIKYKLDIREFLKEKQNGL